jgi:DNA-binding transcriptional LysR family regulator
VVDPARVPAGGPDEPWRPASHVAVAELRDRVLVSLPPGTGVRAALDAVCRAAGFSPRIGFESADLGVVAELAAGGLGAALLPVSVASAVPGLRGVPVAPAPRSSLALAWRTDGPSSPAGRALVAHARRSLPALDPD